MKYQIDYEINQEDHNFKINTYASFCMSYIDQIKDLLDFELVEKEEKGKKFLAYSMDLVNVRKKVPRNKIFRRQKLKNVKQMDGGHING